MDSFSKEESSSTPYIILNFSYQKSWSRDIGDHSSHVYNCRYV
jgi:hypothetical protein